MFDKYHLQHSLSKLAIEYQKPSRYIVAYSGGMDSTVLLHALKSIDDDTPIIALYVNHQVNDESNEWSEFCNTNADSLGINFSAYKVDVDFNSGKGAEASMRDARYKIFRDFIKEGDWLLTAHHLNDQTETLLLNLFRGSGPHGLSGINNFRNFSNGKLVRPLLSVDQKYLRDYAEKENLNWIDDPSNKDNNLDRNFLRNNIIPKLEDRWISLNKRLSKVTQLANESKLHLVDLAKIDLDRVGLIDCYDLDRYRKLSGSRQRNLLRYSVDKMSLPSPPYNQLIEITKTIVNSGLNSNPVVSWSGVDIRRYQNQLYLLPQIATNDTLKKLKIYPNDEYISLGSGMGAISLEPSTNFGIDIEIANQGLLIVFREGGENIRPVNSNHNRKLKKLLQDKQIFPWMRDKIPILMLGDEIVCVADFWIAEKFSKLHGYNFKWHQKPKLGLP
jgi:tRNA(Ile)-lysidine synthase